MELVGREEHVQRLRDLAGEAARGTGRLVLLSGDAGVGKTSLVTAAFSTTELQIVCVAASQVAGAPLGPITAALRVLGRDLPATPSDRAALVAAIVGMLCDAARARPLALILDDLQWADHATLELLPALAEAAKDVPLLVVAIWAADAVPRTHPMRVIRDSLRRTHKVTEVAVLPLGEADAMVLAERCVGRAVDAGTVRRLHAASGGLPFFIEALARSMVTSAAPADGYDAFALPETLRDAVLARFDCLAPAARTAADAAAVIGTQFELAHVASLAGNDAAVGDLIDSGLAVEDANGIGRFRPALAREVLYGALGWTRRRALHRAVAELLEATGRHVDLAAEHWQAAGDAVRARRAFLEAAARSLKLHAHRDVVERLQRALELWPPEQDHALRLTALDQLGDAAQAAGRSADALKAWREVAESSVGGAATPVAARVLRKVANLHELNGDWSRSLDARQEAQAAFAAGGERAEAAIEGITAANRLRQGAQHAAGLEVLVRAAEHAEASGRKDLQVRVAALEANLRVRLGQVSGIPAIRTALEAAVVLDQPMLIGEIYQRLADAMERTGDYRGATSANLAGISFCERRKAPTGIVACLACMSWILIRAGEWQQAEAASRRLAEEFSGSPIGRGVGKAHVGLIHVLRGELRKAEPLLQEGLALARRIGHALLETTCLWGLALHASAGGDEAAAAERCRAIQARIRLHDERHALMPVLRWSASCFARVRDMEGLRACAALLNEAAARFDGGEPLSALAHTLGEIAVLEGDMVRAADQFERAIALLQDLQLPRERVESELRAAAACEVLGRREAAVAHAREAGRGAERLGARPLAQGVVAQLRSLGEALSGALGPRAGRRAGQGGLTGRQFQILAAISRGLTDKEVARHLGLSPRTVESHVAKALVTLDCRSRTEAVRKASELGLLAKAVAPG